MSTARTPSPPGSRPTLRPALRAAVAVCALLVLVAAWLDEEPAADRALPTARLPHAAPATAAAAMRAATPPWPQVQRVRSAEELPVAAPSPAWAAAPLPPVAAPAPQPAAPPLPAAAPPAPEIPPPPYTLIGRIVEGAEPRAVLLSSAQRTLSVKAGEVIDSTWRVLAVGEDSVTLVSLNGAVERQLVFKPL